MIILYTLEIFGSVVGIEGGLQILPFGLHYKGKHCGGCFLYSIVISFEALAPEIAKCGITKVRLGSYFSMHHNIKDLHMHAYLILVSR